MLSGLTCVTLFFSPSDLFPVSVLIHSTATRAYPTLLPSLSISIAYIVHYMQCPLNYYLVLHVYLQCILYIRWCHGESMDLIMGNVAVARYHSGWLGGTVVIFDSAY